jgi:hypothetical protein
MKFISWLEEKKKTKESLPPTATSSPTRGANQDQTGFRPSGDTADYTISDEKVNEISAELVGRVNKARLTKPSKTPAATRTLQKTVTKKWLMSKVGKVKKELDEYEGPDNWEENTPSTRKATSIELANMAGAVHMPHMKIKEASMVSAVNKDSRIQPVNIADNTPRKGSSAVSKRIISGLQASANRRVATLDQSAQRQKEQSAKDREQEVARRQREAEKRQGKRDASNNQ